MLGRISFLECFAPLEDPRIPGLITYPLDELLLTTLCAVLCGCKDWDEISYWGTCHIEWLKKLLPFTNGVPSAQTFNRVFSAIDSKVFNILFEKWVNSFQSNCLQNHVAIDGKTVRGSKQRQDGSGAIHIVSAFATGSGLVIGQQKVNDKSNEITAIPELLKRLALEGSVVTIDAMGTQKAIVSEMHSKKADYLLALKENHKELYEDVELFFKSNDKNVVWDDAVDTDAGHGRIEVRSCTVTREVDWLKERHPGWKGLSSIAKVESLRTNKKSGDESKEVRYYISSLSRKASEVAKLVRDHWGIENSLHWCLDVNFKEDSCRTRTDHGAVNLATIRKIAFNLLKLNKGKCSMKRTMLTACWNLNFLSSLLLNST